MDWSTHDYTRTYADTFFLPDETHDSGVSLLDEAGARDEHPRAPIRDERDVRGRHRETYYTGGNIVSRDGDKRRAIFDAAWDERPMHYNPNAGTDWAHLVPPYARRPYGGGPAPSLAFPMITNSEAQVGPKDLFSVGGGAAAATAASSTAGLISIIQVVLLVVLVVMMACLLNSVSHVARDLRDANLEKEIRRAVRDSSVNS